MSAKIKSFQDEVDQLLSPDLMMERILLRAGEMQLDLSDAEISAIRKVAEAEHAICMATMLMSEERCSQLIDLVDSIAGYAEEVSDRILSGASATMLQ